MGRRRWAFGVTAVALVAMAGCGGGGGGEAAEPPSTEPPVTVAAPTTTVLSEEEAVLAAYQGYWDTWLAANDPPNPDHPDLARYYTGRSLQRAKESIQNLREVGQALRLPVDSKYRHSATVGAVSPDAATVEDCAIDDGLLVARADGRVLNDAVETTALRAELVRLDGRWLVENVQQVARWDGVSGCAA